MGTWSLSRSMASSDLIWQITRNNSSFLVKRNGLQMSAEPNNLMGKNSFKFSGIANANAVGITEEAKGITFSKKNSKRQRQPAEQRVCRAEIGLPESRTLDQGCHRGLQLPQGPHQACSRPLVQDLEGPAKGLRNQQVN